MATHAQAIKRHKQSLKRRARNRDVRSELKTTVKKLRTALDEGAPKDKLDELFRDAESKLARSGRKGVIKKNTVSRRVGRLAKAVANAEGAPAKVVAEVKSPAKKKKPAATRAKKKK